MSWLPRPSNPIAALRDLLAFMRHNSREQRIGAALAILVTAIIVIEFLVDAQTGMTLPTEITFIESYPASRTDAQIIADQKKDQAIRDAAEKEKQHQFQQLEKRLGM
ncbi:MAG: hypothetical protein ABIW33_02205 [Sphingomicrobium sp.]